ncbi:DeoR/GlpR family DNA-binding transcription regulator [Chelativorans sp. AA-79]|uniref:DeoR/GlpR family DNA-binding transcription regulator n=1 Tax=Chelativorans sp. AA-79 TaxID=3028735 RepID=UPI0023F73AA5|nr:DeoR/GlpR family DNA-binding transcription regulator [Chelativorans sp. AA-79]WEX08372.1 DeoR/GlpR family DNA-binding transcription regulator [Chelativorans sp. AA-79]
MSDLDRHRAIKDLLKERPFASVRDLQKVLGVSAATVRRDIDKLHETGIARKVYGGISATDGYGSTARASARPYDENRDIAVEAKQAIARMAETLVRDGDSIMVHAGSTCYHLGVRLARRNLKIYTNSMPLAAHLGERGTCQLVISGGELHREPGIIHGMDSSVSSFFASKFFLGTQGISEDGILESHPLLVRAITHLSERADEIVLLADSRKFSLRPRHAVLPLSRISTLVTDDGVSDKNAKMIEDAGIQLLIAQVAGEPA